MKRIDLLDPVARNAVIEPGVTFEQLQREADTAGLRVMTPVGVPASGSVLATYLECTALSLAALQNLGDAQSQAGPAPGGDHGHRADGP